MTGIPAERVELARKRQAVDIFAIGEYPVTSIAKAVPFSMVEVTFKRKWFAKQTQVRMRACAPSLCHSERSRNPSNARIKRSKATFGILDEVVFNFRRNDCAFFGSASAEEIVLKDLEKFDDCYNELTDVNEQEISSYAFKLGMRIEIQVLTSNVYDS